MGTFRYTTQIAKDMLAFDNTRTSFGNGNATGSLSLKSSNARFYVMKGAVPTQGELDLGTNSFRNADILITKAVNSASTAPFDPNNFLIKMNFTPITAAQGGTASWFLWQGSFATSGFPMFIGTITLPGGGGEMSLTDLNIVSGQVYNIGPASFEFSQRDYTF